MIHVQRRDQFDQYNRPISTMAPEQNPQTVHLGALLPLP